MKDYYTILGIDKNASADEVKKAYRKLAGRYHPDRGGDAAMFKQIQEAYDVLGDAEKRSVYDALQGFYSRKQGFDDILDEYFKFDMRSQMRNSRVNLWIHLEDAVRGGTKLISLDTRHRASPVEIMIPSGVHDEENVRYPGIAPGGMDLVINYRVHGHPVWQRDGLDLLCLQELDFWQLILGTTVIIKSITGRDLKLKIPAMTKPGALLKLKGQGISRQGHNTGDILVKTVATMPDNIPQELVDLLTKYTATK